MRILITSGSPWEDKVGYSRAIRVGKIVEVAGTTATDGEQIIGKGDLYKQTKFIFQKIEQSLQSAGASMADVVRTRMYVTDIEAWAAAGKAHHEFFKNVRPVATMVEVSKLIHQDLLIEIEVTAVID